MHASGEQAREQQRGPANQHIAHFLGQQHWACTTDLRFLGALILRWRCLATTIGKCCQPNPQFLPLRYAVFGTFDAQLCDAPYAHIGTPLQAVGAYQPPGGEGSGSSASTISWQRSARSLIGDSLGWDVSGSCFHTIGPLDHKFRSPDAPCPPSM